MMQQTQAVQRMEVSSARAIEITGPISAIGGPEQSLNTGTGVSRSGNSESGERHSVSSLMRRAYSGLDLMVDTALFAGLTAFNTLVFKNELVVGAGIALGAIVVGNLLGALFRPRNKTQAEG